MAYRKQCDACLEELDRPNTAYLQIHGSISEQVTDDERAVEYRYLTPHANTKLALCSPDCFLAWVDERRKEIPFVPRPKYRTYPHRELY